MVAGVSTACLYPMYTEDSLKFLTENNVKNIEVFVNSHSEIDKDYIKKLKACSDANNAKIVSFHPYTCEIEPMMFFTKYERRFLDILDYYKKYFEAAKLLDAKYLIFHGNKPQNNFSEDDYFERYEKLYDLGRTFGIDVVQENVARCVSGNLEFEKNMMAKLGDKAKFALDTKQAVRHGYDPYEFVSALKSNIKHIHLSDYNQDCDCMLVGKGKLDFKRFAEELKKVNYTESIILELYSICYKNKTEVIENYNYINSLL